MRSGPSGHREGRSRLESQPVVKGVRAGRQAGRRPPVSSLTYDRHRQPRGWSLALLSGIHLGPLRPPSASPGPGKWWSRLSSRKWMCMQISTERKPLLSSLPWGSESTAEKSLYFLKQKPPAFTRENRRPIRLHPAFTTQIRNCEECPGFLGYCSAWEGIYLTETELSHSDCFILEQLPTRRPGHNNGREYEARAFNCVF